MLMLQTSNFTALFAGVLLLSTLTSGCATVDEQSKPAASSTETNPTTPSPHTNTSKIVADGEHVVEVGPEGILVDGTVEINEEVIWSNSSTDGLNNPALMETLPNYCPEGKPRPTDHTEYETMRIIAYPLVRYIELANVIYAGGKNCIMAKTLEVVGYGTVPITPPNVQPFPPPEDALLLTVAVKHKGFRLAAYMRSLENPGERDCGTTICRTVSTTSVREGLEKAREELRKGSSRFAYYLRKVVESYDFRGLYNQLREIKFKERDERVLNLALDHDMPIAFIPPIYEVSRCIRPKDSYVEQDMFDRSSCEQTDDGNERPLFDQMIFSVVKPKDDDSPGRDEK